MPESLAGRVVRHARSSFGSPERSFGQQPRATPLGTGCSLSLFVRAARFRRSSGRPSAIDAYDQQRGSPLFGVSSYVARRDQVFWSFFIYAFLFVPCFRRRPLRMSSVGWAGARAKVCWCSECWVLCCSECRCRDKRACYKCTRFRTKGTIPGATFNAERSYRKIAEKSLV